MGAVVDAAEDGDDAALRNALTLRGRERLICEQSQILTEIIYEHTQLADAADARSQGRSRDLGSTDFEQLQHAIKLPPPLARIAVVAPAVRANGLRTNKLRASHRSEHGLQSVLRRANLTLCEL